MKLRPGLFAFGIALLAGGCVDALAQRQAFLSTLVGKSETDAVRAMGVPNRVADLGGHRFLTYSEVWTDVIPGDTWGPWRGGFWAGGFAPQVIPRACDTTLEIADGRVLGYTLRGNGCGY